VIPPYVLEAIARNGSPQQRERALRTLAIDATIRQTRAVGAKARAGRPRMTPDALAAVAPPGPQRTIADAAHGTTVTGLRELRHEGEPASGDAAADEAYDGLGATWTFWNEVYGRRSIDDADMPLRGVVHYGVDYDNAFWDGRRMVFGDGDGELFERFTRSLDVIGHELGHGVIEDEAGLEYQGQPGALNEHVADVFGSMVKQHALDQTASEADWLIGADLRGPQFHGAALRSMTAPGTAYDDPVLGRDPQPDNFADYVETSEDHGGVHINSGIPNKAFATLAIGLGGHSWETAGTVWYETIRDPRIRPAATFAQFAALTHRVAEARFGPAAAAAVGAAWDAVGVTAT
jgi:Zn-dependent metalloprotease